MTYENFEIYKTFSASTAHIEESDFDVLYSNRFCSYPSDYGIKFYLHDEILKDVEDINCSEGLSLLIIFAISKGCHYIDLDSDGPIYDGFPSYDW